MLLAKELLDILACPQCEGRVTPSEERHGLICENCRLLFPVRDGIPIMLVEEAAGISP